MNPPREPKLSVILATPDTYETIRETIQHLRAQTAQERLELVIVAPSERGLGLVEAELTGFCRVQVVEVGAVTSVGTANAAGIRQASASVVALAEDHAYPDPDWAEALITAHQNPWAAVGPALRNANPDSVISWADMLIGYGPWLEPITAGPMDFLPGHNSSYKRDILLEYGPEMEAMLEAETVLHWHLRSRGLTLYLEPGARIAHVNFARLSSWIAVQWYGGRVFAAARAKNEQWHLLHRLLFAGGAPLIPLVRLRRILGHARRAGRRHDLGVWAAVLFGLSVDALGQMVGYLSGPGNARQKLAAYEHHREHHS